MSDWEAAFGGILVSFFNVLFLKILAPETPGWAAIIFGVTIAYIVASEWSLKNRMDRLIGNKR